jgi:hypothetical protein
VRRAQADTTSGNVMLKLARSPHGACNQFHFGPQRWRQGKDSMVTNRIEKERADSPRQTADLPTGSGLAKHVSDSARRPARWGISSPAPFRGHGEFGLTRDKIELAQRGRLILDVSAADLEAAEAAFGPFHPTTWHFRNSLNEARRSWERLRAEFGDKVLEAALSQPPLTTLILGEQASGSTPVTLVLIDGKTYRAQQVPGTELAPIQWRLTRLQPPLEDGPYYVCRLANRSTQCDCAQWTYRISETSDTRHAHCKHLAALISLGWI